MSHTDDALEAALANAADVCDHIRAQTTSITRRGPWIQAAAWLRGTTTARQLDPATIAANVEAARENTAILGMSAITLACWLAAQDPDAKARHLDHADTIMGTGLPVGTSVLRITAGGRDLYTHLNTDGTEQGRTHQPETPMSEPARAAYHHLRATGMSIDDARTTAPDAAGTYTELRPRTPARNAATTDPHGPVDDDQDCPGITWRAADLAQVMADQADPAWREPWTDAAAWLRTPAAGHLDPQTIAGHVDDLATTCAAVGAHPAVLALWAAAGQVDLATIAPRADHQRYVPHGTCALRPLDYLARDEYQVTSTRADLARQRIHLPETPMNTTAQGIYSRLRAQGTAIPQAISAARDITSTPGRHR